MWLLKGKMVENVFDHFMNTNQWLRCIQKAGKIFSKNIFAYYLYSIFHIDHWIFRFWNFIPLLNPLCGATLVSNSAEVEVWRHARPTLKCSFYNSHKNILKNWNFKNSLIKKFYYVKIHYVRVFLHFRCDIDD